ncbi:MAG: hypothetical protein V7K25_25850 [Nostoc sp.]|uniref:hypothetical protein n=1 Tax=Nostoc sp. TaxID=1180 RepID=UPI002FFB3C29
MKVIVFVAAVSALASVALFVLLLGEVQLIKVVDKAKKPGITNNAILLIIVDLFFTVLLNIFSTPGLTNLLVKVN